MANLLITARSRVKKLFLSFRSEGNKQSFDKQNNLKLNYKKKKMEISVIII